MPFPQIHHLLLLVGQLVSLCPHLPAPTASCPFHTNRLCVFLALSHSKKDQVSWQAGSSQE